MLHRVPMWCKLAGSIALVGCVDACGGAESTAQASGQGVAIEASAERGRYLVQVSGCNDCHTAGYLMAEGEVPEERWLTGDGFGWRGPWGTTYGSNLRLFMSELSEDEWVEAARHLRRRPPMPWFNLAAMSEVDLRSIHRFTRSLGEPGAPAPTAVPPGEEPPMPYASFPSPPGDDTPRELVLSMYERLDAGQLDVFEASVHPEFAAHVMGDMDLDWEGFEQFGADFSSAFPDGRHEFDHVVVQGDYVVTVGHYRGTHEGELMGIPATRASLDLAVMHLDRVRDGKLVEHIGIANGSDLMRQLGVKG